MAQTKKTKKTTKKKDPRPKLPPAERPVLVTTSHRGVFFGYATSTDGDVIQLQRARNVLYWSKATKGFLGLASDGPDNGCRVGPAADIEVRSITCVAQVTPNAVARFEAAPWA